MTIQDLIDYANVNHIPWDTELPVGAEITAVYIDCRLVLDDSTDVIPACGSCRHFTPYVDFAPDKWDEDEPGSCDWQPPALPLSWAYATREVGGVTADMSASACPQWSHHTPHPDLETDQ